MSTTAPKNQDWNIEVAAPLDEDREGYPVRLGPFEATGKADAESKAGPFIRGRRPRLDLDSRVIIRGDDGTEVHEFPQTVEEYVPMDDWAKHPKATR